MKQNFTLRLLGLVTSHWAKHWILDSYNLFFHTFNNTLSFGLILFSLALGTLLFAMLLEVGRADEVTKLNNAKSMQAEKISVKTYRLLQAAFGSKELTGSFTRK